MGEKSFTPLDVRAVVMMIMMMMMKKKKKKKHQVSLGCNSDRSERVLNIGPWDSAREQKAPRANLSTVNQKKKKKRKV